MLHTVRRISRLLNYAWTAIIFALCMFTQSYAADAGMEIDFRRDVRPILSDKCFQCHGPNSESREADLRLDDEHSAKEDRGGYQVVTPGIPAASALVSRITTKDADERMPPVDSGKLLTPAEIDLLRSWIDQGARWSKHWSFVLPVRPSLPPVKLADRIINPIDAYVVARLEQENLEPAPPADKATLLRRVTLDLTGLPPTLEELDAFLADDSAKAYETVVDRLLESRRFGEHMARYWLDVARYADTNGFFQDSERSMWRWRDWVIGAFNDNMPFDQFTVEQLAGDLLPSPTVSQNIATGFNRNHMTTRETGVIDEEYRVEYVVDRLKTSATVWLGLTIGCARCHDHKYDPISQREFYQLFAFFNSVPEAGMKKSAGNAPPLLEVPDSEFEAQLDELQRDASEAESEFQQLESELEAARSDWESTALADPPDLPKQGLVSHFDMEQTSWAGKPDLQSGLLGMAAHFDGDAVIESAAFPSFEHTDAFSFGAWVKPTADSPACVISKNDDVNSLRGFNLMIRKGKAVAHLIHKWNSNAIQVTTKSSISRGRWQHLMVTYDGSGKASGVKIYRNGRLESVDVRYDSLQGTIKTDQPLRIGRRSTSAPFVGWIDDVRIYDRKLSEDDVHRLATGQLVRALVSTPTEERTVNQQEMLREFYLAAHLSSKFQQAHAKATMLRKQVQELERSAPTTMVMQEMSEPRETFLLERGQYDQHGEKVVGGVPACLPPIGAEVPANRLGLARWLVDPAHPLTARVTVNRFWQRYFGTGIVKSVADFGSQGEWPSHPDLLDWLAIEFIESGWDVKHLQRLIVTSATYRQSSKVGQSGKPNLQQIDPENRLLARGPRHRLDAEVVRDGALAISGLLVERIGGASVKPYQPAGLWEAVTYDGELQYPQDHGEALYRRSMYTFWKRQSPPPSMLAFDAPTRETCTVRRPRTNTPLQALTLMNDTTYVEAARALAQRMMTEPTESDATTRIHFALRLAAARQPEPDEAEILLGIFEKQLAVYRHDKKAAEKLLCVGESRRDASLDPAEHAAWTTVASVILNMDETITKN